jgi:ATP-binding cassette subfamily B protein
VLVRRYPGLRNTTLRLLEPLGAPEECAATVESNEPQADTSSGVSLCFSGVRVRAAGHDILRDIELQIASGEHVAIVGNSGAGKSSLVGVLLGWHRPEGTVCVDDAPLTGEALQILRTQTAWVDPQVQLWNASLLGNLLYGVEPNAEREIAQATAAADLDSVLERLEAGFQSQLGEGGALISGGEGQRVRFARAALRPKTRLVVLDEPFRGLSRDKRRKLLRTARKHWQTATLLCVTHDLAETLDFPRVLVVEGGRIVEDGRPAELAKQDSRYRALLSAERATLELFESQAGFKRWTLDNGALRPETPEPHAAPVALPLRTAPQEANYEARHVG